MTDPVKSVERWLEKQGYPLEYQVARTLQRAGFRTWQGIHYQDPDATERRTRDIDVLAAEWPEGRKTRRSSVELVVEVKYSHEPWLVLTTELPIAPDELRPHLLVTDRARPVIRSLSSNPPVPQMLTIPDRHGFNVVQTETRRDPNPAFQALAGVVKAAHAQLDDMRESGTGIFFPVIVVGGSLVQLGYDQDGNRILAPIHWQRIRWQGSTVKTRVLVDVVTMEHFPIWAANARKSTATISEMLEGWETPGALASR